jgi:hypothetical protein
MVCGASLVESKLNTIFAGDLDMLAILLKELEVSNS